MSDLSYYSRVIYMHNMYMRVYILNIINPLITCSFSYFCQYPSGKYPAADWLEGTQARGGGVSYSENFAAKGEARNATKLELSILVLFLYVYIYIWAVREK